MIFAIFTTSLLLTQFLHLALAAGLLWAPFNALLCFKSAKKRALTGWPYAVAGAAYSILLVLPGLYLLMHTTLELAIDKATSEIVVLTTY